MELLILQKEFNFPNDIKNEIEYQLSQLYQDDHYQQMYWNFRIIKDRTKLCDMCGKVNVDEGWNFRCFCTNLGYHLDANRPYTPYIPKDPRDNKESESESSEESSEDTD